MLERGLATSSHSQPGCTEADAHLPNILALHVHHLIKSTLIVLILHAAAAQNEFPASSQKVESP